MKIFVLGDYGLDHYHIGKVRGLSAEVPIPVLDITGTEVLPAMAGNVTANFAALGVDVTRLERGVGREQGVCPRKHRLMTEAGAQIARWDESDSCEPYALADLVPLMEADAIVVADYGKGAITPQLVKVLSQVNLPIFVDTKSDPSGWIGSKAILFPNLAEFKQYEQQYNWIERVVLKQGAQGVSYLEFGQVLLTRPSVARFVQCVNGAGDTVIAAFALAYLAQLPLPKCLEFASAAAGLVVEQPALVRTVTTEAVLERLELEEDYPGNAKGSNCGCVDSAGVGGVGAVATYGGSGSSDSEADTTIYGAGESPVSVEKLFFYFPKSQDVN